MEIVIIMYTDNTQNTKTYTVIEVSKLFGVGVDTVHRMIKDGRLDGEKVKNRYQISEASIIRLVKEGSKNK